MTDMSNICYFLHTHTHTRSRRCDISLSLAVPCKHLWAGLLTSIKDSVEWPNYFLSPPAPLAATPLWLGLPRMVCEQQNLTANPVSRGTQEQQTTERGEMGTSLVSRKTSAHTVSSLECFIGFIAWLVWFLFSLLFWADFCMYWWPDIMHQGV